MHDSAMHAAAATFEWSGTSLGARATWSPDLRLAVDIVLNSPWPMLLVWGKERIVVFNDAYAALAGPRHAAAPGGEVPAVWPAPLAAGRDAYEGALGGTATSARQQSVPFTLDHSAPAAPCDLYFTPVTDAQAQVRGVLCAVAPATAPVAAPRAAGPLRVLVVEDNLDSQYLVCEMLRAFGHEADGVGSAEQALAPLASHRYQVLFSDVSLPGMSGVELARRARQDQADLHVIFASGYGEALLRHVEFPFVSLQKPYDIEQLQAALAAIARQLGGAP